jgi:hypothetical protein
LLKPLLTVVGLGALALASAAPGQAKVHGAYLEARNADLYGGPCTGQARGDGSAAIIAWQIAEGEFAGVPVAGLSVVAVIRGESALSASAPAAPAPPAIGAPTAHSLILVDASATPAQRVALEALVRAQAGAVLGEVVAVEPAPIELAVDPSRALGRLHVADLADLRTRPFNRLDALCGDETLASPPLAAGVDATPAVALEHAFHGDALGSSWDAVNDRGAFVGTFDR